MTEKHLASEVRYKVDGGETQTVWFDSHDLHVITYLFDKFIRKEKLSDHEVTITCIYNHHDIRMIVDDEECVK